MSAPQEQPQNSKSETPPPSGTSACRKKKSDSTSTTFFGDIVDHIDEFVNASMDEHKSCFKKTLNKMFGMSKAVSNGGGTPSSAAPVESVMSRPATTSD